MIPAGIRRVGLLLLACALALRVMAASSTDPFGISIVVTVLAPDAPARASIATGDGDGDGRVDHLTLTFSRLVDIVDDEAGTLSCLTLSGGYEIVPGDYNRTGVSSLVVQVREHEAADSDALITVSYTSAGDGWIADADGEMADGMAPVPLDRAAPVILRAWDEGTIAGPLRVVVQVSEPIDAATVRVGDFRLNGVPATGGELVSSHRWRLFFPVARTEAAMELRHESGNALDSARNPLASAVVVVESSGEQAHQSQCGYGSALAMLVASMLACLRVGGPSRRRVMSGVALLALLGLGGTAQATDYTWNVAGSGLWEVNSNWTPSSGYPSGATDTATVTTINASAAITNTLGTKTFLTLTNNAANAFSIASVAGNIDVGTIAGNGAGLMTFTAALQGSHLITKSGSSAVNLTANHVLTLASGTKFQLSGGRLGCAADNNLGYSPGSVVSDYITLGGGTLVANGTFTLNANRGVTVGASGGGIDAAGGTLTIGAASQLSGSGALTLSATGSNQIVLSNSAALSGTVTVSTGTVQVSNATGSATGSGAVTVNAAGTLMGTGRITGTVQASGTIAPGGAATPGTLTTGAGTCSGATVRVRVATTSSYDIWDGGTAAMALGTTSTLAVNLSGLTGIVGSTTIAGVVRGASLSGTFGTVQITNNTFGYGVAVVYTASQVNLVITPASVLAVDWNDNTTTARTWALGSVSEGSAAVATWTVRNTGSQALGVSVAASATSTNGWTLASATGTDLYLLRIDANGDGVVGTPATYEIDLAAGSGTLSSSLITGRGLPFGAYFRAPTVTTRAGVVHAITITVTATGL